MKYETSVKQVVDGFPHAFGPADFDRLERFLADRLVVPLRELELYPFRPDLDVIGMRHDVDHNLDHAIKFAQWEHDRGIRSSYYVLHSAWYYKPNRYSIFSLPDGCAKLVELGHEVGLHSNVVVEARALGRDPAEDGVANPAGQCAGAAKLLREELDYLRGELGLDVVGTASHGDARCKEWGINNGDLWASGFTPADFDLTYEAYHLNRGRTYLSESAGRWHRAGVRLDDPFDEPLEKPAIVLIHPCHWDVDATRRDELVEPAG